jgi:hypothetical protein
MCDIGGVRYVGTLTVRGDKSAGDEDLGRWYPGRYRRDEASKTSACHHLIQFHSKTYSTFQYGEMCYTSHAIRREQVVRLGVKQSLEIWLCQFETCM